jgi:hypothetical protein
MALKTTEEDNKAFVNFLKRNALLIVIAVSYGIYDIVVPLLTTGAEAEFHQKLIEAYKAPAVKEAAKKEFEANMIDPVVLGKVLASPEVESFSKEAGEKIEAQIVTNVLKEDSTKISIVSGLGKKANIRDEDVMDKLAKLLEAYDKGELLTKKEAEHLYRTKVAKF